MRVYLLQDVPNVGSRHTIVTVADGFARNYLIPQKRAVAATKIVEARADREAERRAATSEKRHRAILAKREALTARELRIRRKASAKGTLFGGLSKADIVTELRRTLRIPLQEDDLDLAKPIERTGEYTVNLMLRAGESIPVRIRVEEERA